MKCKEYYLIMVKNRVTSPDIFQWQRKSRTYLTELADMIDKT